MLLWSDGVVLAARWHLHLGESRGRFADIELAGDDVGQQAGTVLPHETDLTPSATRCSPGIGDNSVNVSQNCGLLCRGRQPDTCGKKVVIVEAQEACSAGPESGGLATEMGSKWRRPKQVAQEPSLD